MSKKGQKSQEQLVYEYLQDHEGITQADAIREFNCYRLSARIKDLRKKGIDIETELRHNRETGANYGFYKLVKTYYIQG